MRKVESTERQAWELTDILEDIKQQQIAREDFQRVMRHKISSAKYEIVKWIVRAAIVNVTGAALLKYAG